MAERFDIEGIFRDADVVARLIPASNVFSFLNRQVTVPASCVAAVWTASGSPRIISGGGTIEANGAMEILFVRAMPHFLDYELPHIASKDGFDTAAKVRLSVSIRSDRANLVAFRKAVLGSENRVTRDDLRRHCDEAVRAAVSQFAAERDVATLVSPDSWPAFDDVLAARFKPMAFESGLSLGADLRIEFTSSSFVEARRSAKSAEIRRQRHEADAVLKEMAAQARREHLAELGAMLEQVRTMADQTGGLEPADLIKRFDAAQRTELYHGLLALNRPARRTQAIVVVGGTKLLWFDPANPDRAVRQQDLGGELGRLRSVRCEISPDGGEPVLFVGAQRGVHVLATSETTSTIYRYETEHSPQGGFNSAARAGDALYATHSEIGLVRWPIKRPGEDGNKAVSTAAEDVLAQAAASGGLCLPEITQGAKAVRDVQTDDTGKVWFSADNRVVRWNPDGDDSPLVLPAPAGVGALVVAGGYTFAGLENGAVLCWLSADPAQPKSLRGPTSDSIRSLCWMDGGGVPRLLLGDKRSHLEMLVVHDSCTSQYRSQHRLRWGFAAEDWIVGVNDIRDRMLIWRADQPSEPAANVSIGAMHQVHIQDVTLIPETA